MPRLSRPAAFWSVGVLLVVVLAASGAPSPLYRVYQARFGFGAGLLTTVFGIYALALLGALLVVGSLSDHVGRRPVLVAALLVQAVAMALFWAADGVGWLIAARVVQGLSTGALTGTIGATLMDNQRAERPLGALLNSAAPGLGLALGAVGVGLLVELVSSPTDWVFGVLTALFVAMAAGVLALPEGAPRLPGAVSSLRPQVHVPAAQRPGFLVAVPCVTACWALGGLYLSLGPSLVAGVFGVPDHLVGSLVILAMNGMGPIGAVTTSRLPAEKGMVVGALSFAVGVAATVLALLTGSLPLFFVAAVVSGYGFGAAFSGAVATATRGVAPGNRAALMSSVFVVGYLAFSIPAIVAGVLSSRFGLAATAEVYGGVLVILALAAVGGLLLRRRAAPAPAAAAPAESDAIAA